MFSRFITFMKRGCPNKDCSHHHQMTFVRKDGTYMRKGDSRKVQRYKCHNCGTRFSNATFSDAKYQKNRRINHKVFLLTCSGVSIRRIAKLLGTNPKTVVRKIAYYAKKSRKYQEEKFWQIIKNLEDNTIYQDDLITIEHTKLKPVSVSVLAASSREILCLKASSIPAFGKLAELSREKYGLRSNDFPKVVDGILAKLAEVAKQCGKKLNFKSDKHKVYEEKIKKYFPNCLHSQYEGAKGCIAGQGELKKLVFDPLFLINHTLAMLRANINRLFRRTWCTTKKLERLQQHLDIFLMFYNEFLLK